MQIHELLRNEIFQILLVIASVFLLHAAAGKFIERIIRRAVRSNKFESRAEEKKREDTLIEILNKTVGVVLWFVAFISILAIVGVNIAGLLTGAGLIGVIVGFGAQNAIKDYIAGMYILIENQYRVGDIVMVSGGATGAGTAGVVEDISLRITKLRGLDGTLNIVRNSEASIISNMTFKHSSVVIDVNVTYDSDIDKVEAAMNAVGIDLAGDDEWKSEVVEPIQFLRVDTFTDSAVVVRAVGKVIPASQWSIAGEYRRRLLKEFRKQHIAIALPHIVVKDGSQPKKAGSAK